MLWNNLDFISVWLFSPSGLLATPITGGIGTLVGTATNFVFKGLFSKAYPVAPEYLSFPKFSAFSIPYMLMMEGAMYLYLLIVYFGFLRPKSAAAEKAKLTPEGIEAAKKTVTENLQSLGKITFWEIQVIILFSLAIALFFCRAPQIFHGWGDEIVRYFNLEDSKFLMDSAAALFVAFLMLLLPSTLKFFDNFKAKEYDELPNSPIPSVLNWTALNDVMGYSFMFLLGGGFALSEAAKEDYTNLNEKIGAFLKDFKFLSNELIILIIIIFTVFTTNFASNVAVCNVITPIVMQLAKEIQQNPLWYNIASGFSASYALCLPVGTPGNLIVQSVANIPTMKMIKAGIGPTISTIIISWLFMCFWGPVIWPDLHQLPDWINKTNTRYFSN
ncbi:protein I'm not dead yet-like isoform X3 [Leptidea sinapis]|uniref:protein I'm not dead yet-like isoform X3 n=1 Tax=Leptidea sinapis TaxID=189913 RepID=UPI0021428E32|nr:protein I'm not dead yet-like isoform X3 [Leptidea sinapis]